MKKLLLISFLAILCVLFSMSFVDKTLSADKIDISEMPVQTMIENLGGPRLIHQIDKLDPEKAKLGEDLIYKGKTVYQGKKSGRISSFFTCVDCHNVEREFENLSSQSPKDRLDYAINNGLAYLPGSSLFGIYNRTSFYNDDYIKKYGDLVINARDSLENATQVCAKYCSSGRYLKDWELEVIMHFFKKNELRMKDVSIPENDLKNMRKYQELDADEKKRLLGVLQSSFVKGYNAKFLPTMDRNVRKYGEGGDAKRGEIIYQKACMSCHFNSRVTYLHLDKDKLSTRKFWKKRKGYKDWSMYQIVRHGTHPKAGRKQYMPLYTEEKMSDKQLNDLMAFIKLKAGK